MLKRLTIRDFRSIVNGGKSPLEFGRLNLFIGPNGAGKSNVIEAIGIVSAALGGGIAPRDLEQRGVRLSLPKMFKAAFKRRKIPKEFKLTAETDNCVYALSAIAGDGSETLNINSERLDIRGNRLFGKNIGGSVRAKLVDDPLLTEASQRAKIEPFQSLYGALKAFLPLDEKDRAELDALSRYAIYAPQTAVLRGQALDARQAHPLGLTGGRLAAALREIRRSWIGNRKTPYWRNVQDVIRASGWAEFATSGRQDPGVVPGAVPSLEDVVYFIDGFMKPERSTLSAYDASEGALYLLFVAVLLHHPDSPRIFALDNVDGTLNPGLVRKLVRNIIDTVAADPTRQVFMTSHNPAALDELDLFNPDHRVYVVHRIENGHTEFYPVRPDPNWTREEWERRKGGKNLSALFVDGEIPYALAGSED